MKKLALILLVLVFTAGNSYSDEPVKFGSFPIPLMVVDKDNGVFVELTKTIAERAGLNIEIDIQSPKRVVKFFANKKVDVLFPALDVTFPSGTIPVKCPELIYIKTDFVFTKKGAPFLKTIDDLKEKSVGITLGYPYVKELTENKQINIEVGASDEVNIKKLIKGRFDAFVVEEKSGLKAFDNLGLLDKMQYDAAVPMSKQDVYYAFQRNAKGMKLAKKIAKTLKEMKIDGTFEAIMKKASGNK